MDTVIQDSANIVAIYGSPRRNGNTAKLLREAVAGARAAGARVDEIVLRDLHKQIAAGFSQKPTPIPWWQGRPLHIQFR